MREADVAWLAGIIEGEGCINIGVKCVSIAVGMTDRDIIERLEQFFPSPAGISTKRQKRADGGYHKTQYVWRTRKAAQVREILPLILPWLGERRTAKAKAALEFLETRPGRAHMSKRTHCPKGHPYDEANTYRDPVGYRSCRACSRQFSQEYRARTGYRWLGEPRPCPVCENEFRPTRKEQRTCSSACGALQRWRTRRANLEQAAS